MSKRSLTPCCAQVPEERQFCEWYKLHLRAWNQTDYLERKPKMLHLWESPPSFAEDFGIIAVLGWKDEEEEGGISVCMCIS